MNKLEYVSVNRGIDIWEIDYTIGIAKLIEHPTWLDWGRLKVRSINESIEKYLTTKGFLVRENKDHSFSFGLD